MKIEIKNYAVYFVLIILIAAMLVFLFQNINKIKTAGKAFTVSIGNSCPVINPTDDPDDYTVFKMSAETNAHAANWSDQNYNTNVCSGAKGTHDCTGYNLVVRLSNKTNAHAENKTANNYPVDVCFGNLFCDYAAGSGDSAAVCSALGSEYLCLASISADTNAHVGGCGAYPTKICCISTSCEGEGYSCCDAGLGNDTHQFSYDNTCGTSQQCWSSCKSIPIVHDIDNVTFIKGSFDESIDLDSYIEDNDTNIAGIEWTFSGNDSIIIAINSAHVVKFTAKADFIGAETITFKATDPDGLYGTTTMAVNVSQPSRAPVIPAIEDQAIAEDALYSYDVNATDEDGDSLAYYLLIKPAEMEIGPETGYIEWMPTNDDAKKGDHIIALKVSDGSLNASQMFIIKVNNVNDPPYIEELGNLSLAEDLSYGYKENLTPYIYDVDNTFESLAIAANSSNIEINGEMAIFNYRLPVDETVNLTVKDPHNAAASRLFNVYVEAVNDAPEFPLTTKKVFKILQGEALSYAFNATDEEKDPITYDTNSTLFQIGNTSGKIAFTAPIDLKGTFDILVSAADDKGAESVIKIYLTIDDKNFAPAISSFTPEDLIIELEAGYEYKFAYTANDADGDPLSPKWYLDGIVKSENATLVFSPKAADLGNHALTLVVYDGLLNDSLTWNITITPENHAPVLITAIPSQELQQNTKKENAFDLDAYFQDADGDQLAYSARGNKNISIMIDLAENTVTFAPDNYWHGAEQAIFIADDGKQIGQSNNVTLTVSSMGICGNDVKEAGEECDGTANSACGAYSCKADCTCNKPACIPNWECSGWSKCSVSSQKTRTCTDKNSCRIPCDNKPECAQVEICAYAPTCSDGVQNQGEEGIDCGGPCAACTEGLSPKRRFQWIWWLWPFVLIMMTTTVVVYEAHNRGAKHNAAKTQSLINAYSPNINIQRERQVQHYIEVMLSKNYPENSIRNRLQQEGWSAAALNRIFNIVGLHRDAEQKQAIIKRLIQQRKAVAGQKEEKMAKQMETISKAFEK